AEMEEVSFVVRRPDTAEPIRHDLEQRAVAGAEIELVPAGPVEVQSHRVHNAVPGVEASSRPDVAVAKRSDRVEPRGIAGRSPDLGPRDHQPSCPGPAHDRGHWAEAAVDGSGPPDVTRGQRADAGDEAGNGDVAPPCSVKVAREGQERAAAVLAEAPHIPGAEGEQPEDKFRIHKAAARGDPPVPPIPVQRELRPPPNGGVDD